MSIAALYELQERLYNTAIAGVNMIGEDFRLQRSMEQFEQTAGASPVFKKIAEQLKPLREAQASDKTTALMDALALIDAVLHTQGATDVSGDVAPITLKAHSSNYYEARYSELHGLKSALTEKGSGRYEIVKSAFDAKSPVLNDFRLRSVFIAALGDSYAEMADLVVEILASGDSGIVPLLKEDFDPKGKREMARRVEVIENLAKEQENEFYLSLVEKSSPVVRLAAVHALKHDAANAELLMSLAETEKGELRDAAYSSLYELKQSDTRAFWLKHAEQSPGEVASYLFDDIGDDVSDVIAGKLNSLLDTIVTSANNSKEATEISQKQYNELESLIYMSTNKASSQLIDVYASIVSLAKLLSKVKVSAQISYGRFGKELHHDLLREINLVVARGIVLGYNEQLVAAASHLYETCGSPYLHAGFCAALVSKPAAEVYDQFSPLLLHKDSAEIIAAVLAFVLYDEEQQVYSLYAANSRATYYSWKNRASKPLYELLDPRWVELLISDKVRNISKYKLLSKYTMHTSSRFSRDDLREQYDVMLMGLINVHDAASAARLKQYFIAAANDIYSEVPLFALQRLGVRDFREWIVNMFQQPQTNLHNLHALCYRLNLEKEEEIVILEEVLALVKEKKIKDRYYSPERLQTIIDELRNGNDPSYY